MSTVSSASSKEKWNELKKLLKPINPKSEKDHRVEAHRLDQLRKLFTSFLSNNELTLANSTKKEEDDNNKDDVKKKWNDHLKKQYNIYITQLCTSIAKGNRYALRSMCGIIAVSSNHNRYNKGIDSELVYKMVQSICTAKEGSEEMIKLLVSEFAHPYLDGQYFVMKSIKRFAAVLYDEYLLAKNENKDDYDGGGIADNLTSLLLLVDNIPMDQSQLNTNVSLLVPHQSNHNDDGDKNNNDEESSDEEDDDDEESDDESNNSDDDDDDDESSVSSTESPTKKQKLTPTTISKKQPIKHLAPCQNIKKLRKILQEVWLSTLRLPISNKLLKKVLRHLPTNVFTKHISSPLRFADFYSASFNIGSSSSAEDKKDTTDVITSLLSLQGLYHLMTQHNLEYPKFYTSLYALTSNSSIFHIKHRIQFCTLLYNCLMKSSMLPAYLIASFCKRLCRICVSGGVPPSGTLFVLALVSNLLRRHGECACLVHRFNTAGKRKNKNQKEGEDHNNGMIMDVFDNDTNDPNKSRALESSLWELDALQNHYHPAVSALAKTVGTEDDKTPLYDLDEFLIHTYKSLFDQERKWGIVNNSSENKKKRKHRAVALTFQEPKSLFLEEDVFSGWFAVPTDSKNRD